MAYRTSTGARGHAFVPLLPLLRLLPLAVLDRTAQFVWGCSS